MTRVLNDSRMRRFAAFAWAAALFIGVSPIAKAQELKAPEIIKRHLESIGTDETRAQKKNYFVVGQSSFASKFPSKKTGGKSLFVSKDSEFFMLVSLMSQEYPFEKIGFFNGNTSLPFVTSGKRSPLGAFISDHPTMLSQGLFGGAIFTTWAPLRGDKMPGRFETAGSKKLNGRKAYVLDYFGGQGSEFSIRLYFDAETFRHVRSEYRHVIPPQQDPFGTLGRQTGVKISTTENFFDFKTVEGMTLPHSYTINYQTDSNSGVFEYDWGFVITDYYFNQKLEPGFFTFEPAAPQK